MAESTDSDREEKRWEALVGESLEQLGPFDPADLAIRIGALQLCVENQTRVGRLTLAAAVVAALPRVSNTPRASARRLRDWLASDLVNSVSWREDPPVGPFTDEIVFHGGSYRVLCGNGEDIVFDLRTVLRAIFLSTDGDVPLSTAFRREALHLSSAGLTLLNECLERANLDRRETMGPLPQGSIHRPTPERLNRYLAAVRFTSDEVDRLFQDHALPADALVRLTQSDAVPIPANLEELSVFSKPFARYGSDLVLLAPGSVLFALQHALLALATETGDLEILTSRISQAAFRSLEASVSRLGCHPAGEVSRPTIEGAHVTRRLHSLDSDKALLLLLVCDQGDEFNPVSVDGVWDIPQLGSFIRETIEELELELALSGNPPNEIVVLVSIQGIGRSLFTGFGPVAMAHLLAMPPAGIETVSTIETGRDLLLWSCARAQRHIRDVTERVHGIDPLDEFANWRNNNFSYYMFDDSVPTVVMIAPGGAGEVRTEARDRIDRHGVISADGRHVIEVFTYDQPGVPIYAPLPSDGDDFRLTVDGLPVQLWVVGSDAQKQDEQPNLARALIDLVAYWMWQCNDLLQPALESLSKNSPVLVIEVDFETSESWFEKGDAPDPDDALSVELKAGYIRVWFSESAGQLFFGPDNSGERALLRKLIPVVLCVGDGPSDPALYTLDSASLDGVAPLGQKKKLVMFDGESSILLEDHGLPDYRPLQDTAVDLWRELDSEVLAEVQAKPGEVVESSERVELLNRVVQALYERFQNLVATFDPTNLLETLVALQESIIRRQSWQERSYPTRLACFGEADTELAQELLEQSSRLATTAVASRFAIEYIVAKPPSGLRPFSLAAYDELIALAAIILGWAWDSDAIRYGVFDVEISVLGSGRLGHRRREGDRTESEFLGRWSREQGARAIDNFANLWSTDERPDAEVLGIGRDDIDDAWAAEFGFGLQELADVLSILIELSREQGGVVGRASAQLIRDRADASGIAAIRCDAIVEFLTLARREDYLKPPPGFVKEDIYPWRFSRRLSYLARPLSAPAQDGNLIWGSRALIQSLEYHNRMLTTGRLRGRSPELTGLIGRMTNRSGHAFTDSVAAVYRAVDGLIVETEVKKIGRLRLARPSGDHIGDVDVFVADRSRRIILAVETKDFSPARTPAEYASEVQELIDATEIHEERVAWLEAHMSEVLQWLHIDNHDEKRWRVQPLIVVSSELFVSSVPNSIPIRTIRTLRTSLGIQTARA